INRLPGRTLLDAGFARHVINQVREFHAARLQTFVAREHETACMSSDSFRDRLPGQDEGPPLRFPYQLAVSAVQTEYRPVPGLERPALAQTGTLHSCIAG